MRFAKQRVFIAGLFLMLPLAVALAVVQTPLVSDLVLQFALKVARFRTHLKVDARTWEVSPFTFSARLIGVSADFDGVQARVPDLSVQVSPLSLLFGEIHLRRLRLESPTLSGRLAESDGKDSPTEHPSDVPTWIGLRLASLMSEVHERHINFDDLEVENLSVDLNRVRIEGLDLRLSNLDLGQARVELSIRGAAVPGHWARVQEASVQASLLRESSKTFYLALSKATFQLSADTQSTRAHVEGRWPGRLRGRLDLDLSELQKFGRESPDAPADLILLHTGRFEADFEAETGKAKLQNLSARTNGRNLYYDDYRAKDFAANIRVDLSGASPVVRLRDLEIELPPAPGDRVSGGGGRLRAKELVVENSSLKGQLAIVNASVCAISYAAGTPDCFSALTTTGKVDLEGSLEPLELKAKLDLEASRALVSGEPFANVPLPRPGSPDPAVSVVIKPSRMSGLVVLRDKYLQLAPAELRWPDASAIKAEGKIEYKPTVLDLFATTEALHLESAIENLADLNWQGEMRSEARVQYSMKIPKSVGRTQIFARAQIARFGLQGQVFGDVNGPLIFTGDTLRLGAFQVKAGGGSARVDGALKMPAGAPSRLALNGVFDRIELTSASSETQREIFRGFVSGTGGLEGTLNAAADPEHYLSGNLNLRADSFRFYGFPLQSAVAQARYEKSQLIIKSIHAKKGDSTVDVEGTLDPKGGSELRFRAKDLVVRDMDLDPGLKVLENGKAHFDGRWRPSVGWGLEGGLSGVKIAGRTLPEGPLKIGGDNESFHVDVKLPGAVEVDYESRDPKGQAKTSRIKGKILGDGVYALFAYLEGWINPQPLEISGGMSFDFASDRGSLGSDGIEIAGQRRSDGTRQELIKIAAGQRIAWTGKRIESANFQTESPTKFRIIGGPGADRFRLEGELPLAFIDFFVPSIRLGGGNLSMEGEMPLPPSLSTLSARGHVKDGELLIQGLDETATGVVGDLDFRDGQLFFDGGHGRLGGGSIDFSGAYKLNDSKSGISLRTKLNRAHVIILDDIPMDLTGDLNLTGEDFPWLLSGQLTAVNGLYTKPFVGEESREVRRDPRLRFDLDFELGSNVVIRNELINAPMQGRLHLAGTEQDPLLQGRILMGSGMIYANENEFRIAQGNVSFTGAPGNVPIVSLEASTTVRSNNQSYKIQLSANGPGNALNFGFTSEPSIATQDIVNLLAFGILRPTESGTEISSDANLNSAAQWQALQILFGKSLGQNLDRSTGLQVRVQTQQSKAQTAEAIPKLTVYRKLTDRVSVTLGSSLDQTQKESDMQVDYRLLNNVNLTGVWEKPDQNQSSVGVDLRFKFDIK